MSQRLTGDEVQSREAQLPITSLVDFMRQMSTTIPAYDATIIHKARDAEQSIRAFRGTRAELKKYAWETLTPVLASKFESSFNTHVLVNFVCDRVVRQSCVDDEDLALISQRSGYMTIRMENNEEALDAMAAGFTRKITVDEVSTESPQKYRTFLNELSDMGKRKPCSLNERKMRIANVESECVLHLALSYKHASKCDMGGTIDEAAAKMIARSVHTYLTMTNRTDMRLWVDQVSSKNLQDPGMAWGAIGLLPYATLRVMVIPNRDDTTRNVEYMKRPWLFYELYAAMMGQGLFVLKNEITPELSRVLRINEARDEHRDVFDRNGIFVGRGEPVFSALDSAMARCLTDHELNIAGYLYSDDFMQHCNWAIRRYAWKEWCSIGWRLSELPVDTATLYMYVRNLCSPLRGVRYMGQMDPLVCGTQFGTRKREGPLYLEEIFNDIPFFSSEGTPVDELFDVIKWHERDGSERFRISSNCNEHVYIAMRGNQIRLCEAVHDSHYAPTRAQRTKPQIFRQNMEKRPTTSQKMQFRSKSFSLWPASYEDSDSVVSREKKCAMLECASRVTSSRMGQVARMLGALSNAAAKDRSMIISMYTQRFRSWVDTSVGSNVNADSVRVARKFVANDEEMTDDELLDAINDMGKTVSFQNLRDKMYLICWHRAKTDPTCSHVLEICIDGKEGLFIYLTDVKKDLVKTQRRVFVVREQRMQLPNYVFVLLNEAMEEDDIVALASLYGAVSARTIQTSGEWPLYSRVPNAGIRKNSVKLPQELVEGGVVVGFKKYSFHAEGDRDLRIIIAERVQHTGDRILLLEHPRIIRSALAVYSSNLRRI